MHLLITAAEPDAATLPQRLGLLDLLEPERPAVERARRLLTAGGSGELDVVESGQHLPDGR
jgi:hypothetical protein